MSIVAKIEKLLEVSEISSFETISAHIEEIRVQGSRTFFKFRKIAQFEPYVGKFTDDIFEAVLTYEDFSEDVISFCKILKPRFYMKVSGEIATHPKHGTFEMHILKLEIISSAPEDFTSLMPKYPSTKTRRAIETRPLFLTTMTGKNILTLWDKMDQSFDKVFRKLGAIKLVQPPMFVASSCEGGATLFSVPYPGLEKAYLTQSSQFALETILPSVGFCYCLAPSFRAEKSHTRRHVCTFMHLEAEIPEIESIERLVECLDTLWRGFARTFVQKSEQILKQMGIYEEVKLRSEMESIVMTHEEAILYCQQHEIYFDLIHKSPFQFGDDIPEAQERMMTDQIGKVIYLTRSPKKIKSFYMADDGFGQHDDGKGSLEIEYTKSCDVLFPSVGEIIGSGARESDHDRLMEKIIEQRLDPKDYLSLLIPRKYGHTKTAGFGLGTERFMTFLLGDIFKKTVHDDDDCLQAGISIIDITPFPAVPSKIH